jgi:hypothetical protein
MYITYMLSISEKRVSTQLQAFTTFSQETHKSGFNGKHVLRRENNFWRGTVINAMSRYSQ